MLLKLFTSGFYAEDTSTLLVPRYLYWKIYILHCLMLGKKPPNPPEILRSQTTFLYQIESETKTASMCWQHANVTSFKRSTKKKKQKNQPKALERNNSWMPFPSAIAICTAQTTGSAPEFNISCTGECLQRTAGALFLQDGTFTRKKIICILKQVIKLNTSDTSPHYILYPATWKAHSVWLQTTLSSCTTAAVGSSKNNCLLKLSTGFPLCIFLSWNFFCFLMWWHFCAILSDTSDVNITEPDSYFIVSSKSKDCWTI